MLGLAVLLGLGLWVILTIKAMRIGWRLGKKSNMNWLKWFGLFVGFFITSGWFIISEAYHFTREQIWVSKFCSENPRRKIYIPLEKFAEIIKTGDYSKYQQNQLKYKVINDQYIEIEGEVYELYISYKNSEVKTYANRGRYGVSAYYNKLFHIYRPYDLVLIFESYADSGARDALGLKGWFNLIRDCDRRSLKKDVVYDYLLLTGYRNEK